MPLEIRKFNESEHREPLIDLWKQVFNYDSDRNEPGLSIDKKLAVDDRLFVAVDKGRVVGSVMAGYDGHRGWLYSLAVAADSRRNGIGTALVEHVESCLAELGCIKINLQILEDNQEVVSFYQKRGYRTEPRVSMGKELPANIAGKNT